MEGLPHPAGLRIRLAGRGDLPVLVELRRLVGWNSGGLEGSLLAAEAGRQVLLLAEWGGRPAGAVALSLPPMGGGGFGRGHISDLLVVPLYRRRGIGTALLRAAEREIADRGLAEATLDVDAGNRTALRLYLGNGYQHHRPARFPWGPGYTLRKVLRPDAVPTPPRPGQSGRLTRLWRRWSPGSGLGP